LLLQLEQIWQILCLEFWTFVLWKFF